VLLFPRGIKGRSSLRYGASLPCLHTLWSACPIRFPKTRFVLYEAPPPITCFCYFSLLGISDLFVFPPGTGLVFSLHTTLTRGSFISLDSLSFTIPGKFLAVHYRSLPPSSFGRHGTPFRLVDHPKLTTLFGLSILSRSRFLNTASPPLPS